MTPGARIFRSLLDRHDNIRAGLELMLFADPHGWPRREGDTIVQFLCDVRPPGLAEVIERIRNVKDLDQLIPDVDRLLNLKV